MTMYFLQNLLSFQMHHVVHIYTKIFYKLFFKFYINKFFMKNRPTWWDECPFKLIKIIYIYMIFRNNNMNIWWTILKNYLGIYIIIKLIFETLILKLEYHVEPIGWPWKKNLYENHRKIFNIFKKYFWFSYFLYY